MDEPLQKSLERYDVLDRIAVGGMAEVFLAKAYGAHGFENTMCPLADFTAPVPWQCVQRLSLVCSRPAPWHVWQRSCRVTVIWRCPPRIASSKLSVIA